MKKYVLLFFAMLSVVTVSAQTWNESTQDAAFEAPNSVLTSPTWHSNDRKNGEYTFRTNGTFTFKMNAINDGYSIVYIVPGTWRRKGTQLTIVANYASADIRLRNPEKYSARIQEEAKRGINEAKTQLHRKGTVTSLYELLRLDADYLVMGSSNGKMYNDLTPERYISSKAKERIAKKEEERRLAEEKAAEERRLAEEKAAEERRLAKEKEKQLRLAEYEKLLAEYKSGDNIRPFIVNGVPFKMVLVEGGKFKMGCTSEESDYYNQLAKRVKLSDFMIGETEVTQELWEAVMADNPSYIKNEMNPVETVYLEDCKTFIEKLNNLTGQQFRLPTEAEWEFAARGGNKSQHFKYSGSNNLEDVAWSRGDGDYIEPHPVGTKKPNELGLYDMSGNVWEWCEDPKSGKSIKRGGSIKDVGAEIEVWFRDPNYGHGGSPYVTGFRLALSISE